MTPPKRTGKPSDERSAEALLWLQTVKKHSKIATKAKDAEDAIFDFECRYISEEMMVAIAGHLGWEDPREKKVQEVATSTDVVAPSSGSGVLPLHTVPTT